MTVDQISDTFDYIMNKSVGGFMLDEYNKSLYLTRAQHMIIDELTRGYEFTDAMRHMMTPLLKTVVIPGASFTQIDDYYQTVITSNEIKTVAFEVVNKIIKTIPKDLNDIHDMRENPFRKPNLKIAYRCNFDDGTTRVYTDQQLTEYSYTYVQEPTPIVLEDFTLTGLDIEGVVLPTTCVLNDKLTNMIIERAVTLARQDLSVLSQPEETKDSEN